MIPEYRVGASALRLASSMERSGAVLVRDVVPTGVADTYRRGLEDLFGLALFLGSSPWNEHTTWRRALLKPYLASCPAAAARAHKWVSGVFWRTQKEDVLHEISLPPQVECLRRSS